MSSNIVSSKFIYARHVSSLIQDDHHVDSVLFPVESFRGMRSDVSTGLCAFFFENPQQYEPTVAMNSAYIFLEVATGSEKEVSIDLANEIAFGHEPIIVLADNVTNEYFTGVVSTLGIAQDTT